eukprot:9491999-Lingulodinium_polyedra.AAC.1
MAARSGWELAEQPPRMTLGLEGRESTGAGGSGAGGSAARGPGTVVEERRQPWASRARPWRGL